MDNCRLQGHKGFGNAEEEELQEFISLSGSGDSVLSDGQIALGLQYERTVLTRTNKQNQEQDGTDVPERSAYHTSADAAGWQHR